MILVIEEIIFGHTNIQVWLISNSRLL